MQYGLKKHLMQLQNRTKTASLIGKLFFNVQQETFVHKLFNISQKIVTNL